MSRSLRIEYPGAFYHVTARGADIGKAQQLLGWKPQVCWEEGLSELVGWARSAISDDRFEKADQELHQRNLVG